MKRLIACLLLGVFAVLGCSSLGVYCLDPYFHYHDPDVTGDVWMDERYQAAGLLRTQDYDTVLMGTSLAANYQPSWLDEAFGGKAVQVTLPNGSIDEFSTVLHYAMDCQDVNRVVMGLDANIVARAAGEDPYELPTYLYNHNPVDDLAYLWNKETLAKGVYAQHLQQTTDLKPLDEAFLWDYTFSKVQALVSYPRPEPSDTVQPDDYFLTNAQSHLDVVTAWLETYPDVDFHFYLSPYSVLFWDKMDREGTTQSMLTLLDYLLTTLSAYDNATVHFFMGDTDIITNLDNYTDHIHVSAAITHAMVNAMAEGTYAVETGNIAHTVDELGTFVVNYDYNRIFTE